MLDIRALRQDGDAIREALKKRGYDLDLAGFESLDARRKEADMLPLACTSGRPCPAGSRYTSGCPCDSQSDQPRKACKRRRPWCPCTCPDRRRDSWRPKTR